MSISFAIFTYINVWWVMLFIVLPFGIRTEENPGVGYVAAPKSRKWKKIVLINSLVSIVPTAVLALMIHYGVVPLKDMR